MYAAIRKGVNDVLENPPCVVSAAVTAKLDYMDSDLLRLANVNMRYMQAVEPYRPCPIFRFRSEGWGRSHSAPGPGQLGISYSRPEVLFWSSIMSILGC